MDVKTCVSAWSICGKRYMFSQPEQICGSKNPPNYVYKLKKALYGLKQAPRAWYDMLSSFLISNDFSKGLVDPTLFIREKGKNYTGINLMSMNYLAASTPKLYLSKSHKASSETQSKYALESLKKYGFESCDPVDTPMVEKSKLDEDKEGKVVDPSHYRGSAYQKALKCGKKDLSVIKKGTVYQGLWYLKDSSIALTAFADANHAGCQDTRRSTSGSIQLLGDRLVSWSSKRQKCCNISTEAE
ncbi:retrovirus-related pol polyprotein from transposon TNT 1-94 [Tanacetum coccineum]